MTQKVTLEKAIAERDELLDMLKQAVLYWRSPKGAGPFFKLAAKRCGLEPTPKPAASAVTSWEGAQDEPAEEPTSS